MIDMGKDLARFDDRCRRFRDESGTGSVKLLVKFTDGQPALSSISHTRRSIAARSPIDEELVSHIVNSLWSELSRENKRFFGEISIERIYFAGKLVDVMESATAHSKV